MDQTRGLDTAVDDLATARALIASLQDQLTTSQREVAALRHQLDVLCQRLFGKRSERVDPRQLQLALEQLANEPGPITEPVEMDSGDTPVRGHSRRRPTGRRPLPAHLPRRRVEIDIAEADKQCVCGHPRTRIGEDVSEKLEYEPASFVVIETVRPKYACPHCHEGVIEAQRRRTVVSKLDRGYGDFIGSKISEEFWTRKSQEWEAELQTLDTERARLEQVNPAMKATAEKILELAKQAENLYKSQDPAEQRRLLETVLSNCTFDRGSLSPTYSSPFDRLVRGNETGDWRREWDSNPR